MTHCYVYESKTGGNYISFEEDRFLAAIAIADKANHSTLSVERSLMPSRVVKRSKVVQHFRSGYSELSKYTKA